MGVNNKQTVLITGGAGFLGSHISERLLGEQYFVICLDNLLTGQHENIKHLLKNKDFRFYRHDVTNPIDLKALDGSSPNQPHPHRVDFVLHFASPASPKDYHRHPIHTLKVGALGTYHALGLAKAYGSIFILASSSEVYGDPEVIPQDETYWGHVNPIGPRSVYDEAKRYAEAITTAYRYSHGLDTRIARIFNTYGPRMRLEDGRALPAFFVQALRGQPVTVYGDGSQTRSLCYVDDLVEGIVKIMRLNPWLHDASNSAHGDRSVDTPKNIPVFNLGNPEEVTILQLAREIIELTKSNSRIVFNPMPIDDPKTRRPDITHANDILNWEPHVDRRDGLNKVLVYFKTLLQQ